MLNYKTIKTRDRGHRTICGADWPISDRVVRDSRGSYRPTWLVIRGLCNGVPDTVEMYPTRRDALEAL